VQHKISQQNCKVVANKDYHSMHTVVTIETIYQHHIIICTFALYIISLCWIAGKTDQQILDLS